MAYKRPAAVGCLWEMVGVLAREALFTSMPASFQALRLERRRRRTRFYLGQMRASAESNESRVWRRKLEKTALSRASNFTVLILLPPVS